MDEQGIPFEDHVAKAVNGKNVVCFLKYIDRRYMGNTVRDYPIVKIYIQENNDLQVAVPHKETTGSQAECVGVVLPAHRAKVSDQLFSPTTKQVLDEIATSAEGVGSLNKASPAKKCLQFQEACPLNPVMPINAPAYPSLAQEMDLIPPGFPDVLGSHDSTGIVVKVEKQAAVLKGSPVEVSSSRLQRM